MKNKQYYIDLAERWFDALLTEEEERALKAFLASTDDPDFDEVKAVAGSGYDGWYTLENPVGDVMNDSVRQVAVVSRWISEVQGVSGRPRCVCSECG